jgi:hypothetical protein
MYDCEYDLEQALSRFQKNPDKWSEGDYTVEVPLYVVEDAIERLKRYEVIASNLNLVSIFLWKEHLRKYGEREIHPKERRKEYSTKRPINGCAHSYSMLKLRLMQIQHSWRSPFRCLALLPVTQLA